MRIGELENDFKIISKFNLNVQENFLQNIEMSNSCRWQFQDVDLCLAPLPL